MSWLTISKKLDRAHGKTDMEPSDTHSGDREALVVVSRPPYGQAILLLILAVLAAMLAHWLITSPRWQWHIVGQYLLDQRVLSGVVRTIYLTFAAMLLAIIVGLCIALMSFSSVRLVRLVSKTYIWIFRSIPALVQILLIYYLAALLPTVSLGIPFGPEFWTAPTNSVISRFTAALLGLGLCEAAYVSEIFRGGLLAVDKGQHQAGLAVGLTSGQLMRTVVLPQAIRVIIPPLGNQFIGMLKMTSLVSVIAFAELLTTVQIIYAGNFQQIPLLMVAVIWYFLMVTIMMLVQRQIERHYNRGYR